MWTHIFDLLAKALSLAFVAMMFILGSPDSPAKNDTMILVLSFVAGAVLWWIALRPLSSWLHARVRLGARLSWEQARRASLMFSPVRLQDLAQWHPLWEVRQLPAETRVAAIEDTMSRLLEEREAKAARWRAASPGHRAYKSTLWGGMAVLVVVSILNLPPASWLAEFQARRFDGVYYPQLNLLIMILPFAGLLGLLEHAFGVRSVTMVSNPPQPDEAEAAIPPPSATATSSVEKETVVDPDDHSRFAPPSGSISPRQE